jgi:hypothetical protein
LKEKRKRRISRDLCSQTETVRIYRASRSAVKRKTREKYFLNFPGGGKGENSYRRFDDCNKVVTLFCYTVTKLLRFFFEIEGEQPTPAKPGKNIFLIFPGGRKKLFREPATEEARENSFRRSIPPARISICELYGGSALKAKAAREPDKGGRLRRDEQCEPFILPR